MHFLRSVLNDGFVETSKAAMAAVKSEISFVVNEFLKDPAAAEPPCREEEGLADLDLTFGRSSEITGPEAEGGALFLGAGDGLRDEAADSRGDGRKKAAGSADNDDAASPPVLLFRERAMDM